MKKHLKIVEPVPPATRWCWSTHAAKDGVYAALLVKDRPPDLRQRAKHQRSEKQVKIEELSMMSTRMYWAIGTDGFWVVLEIVFLTIPVSPFCLISSFLAGFIL